MDKRLELHQILVETLGSSNVYFQPPPNVTMKYPCIVYQRNNIDIKRADNLSYNTIIKYSITLIDQNPDTPVLMKLVALPLCSFDRHFIIDNLNHDTFNLYY